MNKIAVSENQIIIIWAFITAYLVKLITCVGDMYQYYGYFPTEYIGDYVKVVLGLFFIPHIFIVLPVIAVIIIPIIIMLGLFIRFVFDPKNATPIQARFLLLTLLLWTWSEINQVALEAIASV